MTLFNRGPDSFLGRIEEWMTPERGIALQGLGMGLSQLGSGQPVDLSQSHQALMQRQQSAEQRRLLDESGIPTRFTPDQQAILAMMPPEAAMRVIAQEAFRPPAAPVRGVEIGGRLVNPATGQVMADFSEPEERRIIEGADGYQYFLDNGERVLPDVVAGGADVPSSVREYEYYQQQEVTAGREPMSFGDWQVSEEAVLAGPQGQAYTQPITPGQEAVDEEFASEYVAWNQGGGADAMSQLSQIEAVVGQLESGGQNLTGPLVGSMPDAIGSVINPQAVDAREQVEEVVQRNLRLILGAQFTAQEGERLIARAYNPRLSEEQNAARLRRLVLAMESAAESRAAQMRYFEQHGTLVGFQGTVPSLNDFARAVEGDGPLAAPSDRPAPPSPTRQAITVEQLQQMSPAEVSSYLEGIPLDEIPDDILAAIIAAERSR
ncbi:hypothetical protein [Gymnodinialimonas sp.]